MRLAGGFAHLRMLVRNIIVMVAAACVLPASAQNADKALQEQLAKSDEFFRAHAYEDATRVLQQVAKTPAGQKSYPALFKLAKAYRSIGAYDMCAETALKAAGIAENNAQRGEDHWLAGLCYTEKREGDIYPRAEQELRAALQLAPENDEIHVSLGSLFMQQHRDADGIAEMKLYLGKHPEGPLSQTARAMVEAPALARLLFMPDFRINTFDGRTISSTDLKGKVVLVDFWAPWCAPCRAAIPHLRSLLKQYPEDSLAIISVCGDEKEDVWYKFIQENAMDWPQYYDRFATMRRIFDVKNYPTYFIIDFNGIIRTKVIGVGPEQITGVENEVKREIERRNSFQQNISAQPASAANSGIERSRKPE